MKFKRQVHEDVSVNLTPLIDVVFLLLIFFMVSTSFVNRHQLSLTLPEGSTQAQAKNQPLSIAIDKNGTVFVANTALADAHRATLKAALTQQLEGIKVENKPIELSADRQTEHGLVVMVLDVAAELGLTNVRIKTRALQK